MKKKTLYTLFCTTILLPGMVMGMDESAVGDTPAAKQKAGGNPRLLAALAVPTDTPLGEEQKKRVKERLGQNPTDEEIAEQVKAQGGHLITPVYRKFAPEFERRVRDNIQRETVRDVKDIEDDISAKRTQRDMQILKQEKLDAARKLVEAQKASSTENTLALEEKAKRIEEESKRKEEASALRLADLQNQLRLIEEDLKRKISELEAENLKLEQESEASVEIAKIDEAQMQENQKLLETYRDELSRTKALLLNKQLLLEVAEEEISILKGGNRQLGVPVQRSLVLDAIDQVEEPQPPVATLPQGQGGQLSQPSSTVVNADESSSEDVDLGMPGGLN